MNHKRINNELDARYEKYKGILKNLTMMNAGQDFHCKDPRDIHSGILAKCVYELKESQEGVNFMSREMDEIYNEGEERGRAQGFAEGAMEKAKETALTLADRGMSASDIADIVKVNVKLVQEWLSGSKSLVK